MKDPFPTERFAGLLRRMPAYGRLAWRLGRDPRVGSSRRAALVGAMAYVASPIDLIPGIIPVAGQLDDAAVALLGLRLALDGLPPSARAAHLAAAGLVATDIDDDLATVRLGAAWLLRHGARLAAATARGLARAAASGTRVALASGRAVATRWPKAELRP